MLHGSILQLLAWTGLVAALAGSAIAAGWWYVGRERVKAFAPEPRLRRLVLMAVLPLLAGLYVTSLVVLPSVLDAAGLVADHCHVHPNHHFHLCLVHGHHAHTSVLGWLPLGAICLMLGVGALRRVGACLSAGLRLRRLWRDADRRGESDVHTVRSDRPIALTTGIWRPRIILSDRLVDVLGERERKAIETHERAHGRRRHTLLKMFVDLCGMCHLPAVRRWLQEETSLACEQIADGEAACKVGDEVTVAETILEVERLFGDASAEPTSGTAFGGSDLERRVEGLLEEPWEGTSGVYGNIVCIVGLTGVWWADAVHHGIETMFAWVMG